MTESPYPSSGWAPSLRGEYPQAENSTRADALPLGPESLVWRYFGDNRMFLIGPRPAVLQNMLAELGQGVLDHSVFFADTAARVKRSLPTKIESVVTILRCGADPADAPSWPHKPTA